MKKAVFTLLAISWITFLNAQVTEVEGQLKKQKKDTVLGWKTGGTVTVNISQTALKNWSAGGQNSVSLNGLLNLFATFKSQNGIWENYLDLGYGSIKQDGNTSWWKTDDKIDFTSKYGQRAFSDWYYAALLNFKTQFTDGYNYPEDSTVISGFMAPGYVLGALGLDYKPSDKFTAFVAPVTSKLTFVNNQDLADAGAFGVESALLDDAGKVITSGENFRAEIGGYVRFFYKQNLMENVDLQTKLDLFSNYLNNPQNIDLNWEVLLSMKVNKYISATITTQLIYDDDVDIEHEKDGQTKMGPMPQFKEVLGVGFSYKF